MSVELSQSHGLGAKYDSDAFHLFTTFGRGYNTKIRYHSAEEYSSAIKDFTYVLRRKPGHFSKTYYLRGDCFVAVGLLKMAIKDYTVCLKYHPTDGKVWYYKARALAGKIH